MTLGFIWGWFTKKKQRPKISCYCPFKILSIRKKHLVVKKYLISSYSTAKNMLKIAEVKLSSCGLRKKLRLRNCGATSLKKLRNCDCGSASIKLQNCDCGLERKLRMPTSARKYEKAFSTHLGPSYWIQSITRNAPQTSLYVPVLIVARLINHFNIKYCVHMSAIPGFIRWPDYRPEHPFPPHIDDFFKASLKFYIISHFPTFQTHLVIFFVFVY